MHATYIYIYIYILLKNLKNKQQSTLSMLVCVENEEERALKYLVELNVLISISTMLLVIKTLAAATNNYFLSLFLLQERI